MNHSDEQPVAEAPALPLRDPRSSRAGGGTRTELETAARRLFARHGFDGTSVRAITTAAGANLGAVTYHFGSKESLYHEVLETALEPMVERVRVAVEGPGTPLERCDAVVRSFMDQLELTPDVPHLLLQEMAQGRPPPPPVASALRANAQRLTALILEGQSSGSIRSGDPMLLALSLIAQPIYLALVRIPLRSVIGMDLSEPAARGRASDHIAAFALAGLRAKEDTG